MPETRWPRRIFRWTPPRRRKRGKPKKSWNESVPRVMRDRDLNQDIKQDLESWKLEGNVLIYVSTYYNIM